MQELTIHFDGEQLPLDPSPLIRDAAIWVPLEHLCEQIGAHTEEARGENRILVCLDDRCVPLKPHEETLSVDGVTYVPLASIADPLGLDYRVAGGGALAAVGRLEDGQAGAIVGEQAPGFTLPEVRSGQSVSLEDYRGKKTLVFAWASW